MVLLPVFKLEFSHRHAALSCVVCDEAGLRDVVLIRILALRMSEAFLANRYFLMRGRSSTQTTPDSGHPPETHSPLTDPQTQKCALTFKLRGCFVKQYCFTERHISGGKKVILNSLLPGSNEGSLHASEHVRYKCSALPLGQAG